MEYNDFTLHGIWKIEIEIMDLIHKICVEHDLKYSLAFGTLIGAVRHAGFIPWDDDIDIVMPREDYNKFLSIWYDIAPSGYVLQNKDNSPDFEQNFTKIRKDKTAFLQDETERCKVYHKGIFVDIAPCDRVAPNKLLQWFQFFACALELLYSKEHLSDTRGIVSVFERLLLMFPRRFRSYMRKKARLVIGAWGKKTEQPWFCSDTIQNCRRYFSKSLFDELVLTKYENKQYYVFLNPDDFLNIRYGNYWELPPESERVWKHHPIVVDFENNYEELTGNEITKNN